MNHKEKKKNRWLALFAFPVSLPLGLGFVLLIANLLCPILQLLLPHRSGLGWLDAEKLLQHGLALSGGLHLRKVFAYLPHNHVIRP